MSQTTDARRRFLDWAAEQFLHNSPSGPRLIAVEGADEAPASRFADDLANALDRRGQHVLRRSLGEVEEAELRRGTIEPFRAGALATETDDTVLVVDGGRLLNRSVRGIWHFTVWTLAADELPHAGAHLIVDLTDEAEPKDYYYDLCRLPPSFGERS